MKAFFGKLGGWIKKHKKLTILVGIVAVGGAALALMPKSQPVQMVNASQLARMDLENAVSLSGSVESDQARSVYSTLSYLVESVEVEVGDTVQAGDVLAQLDTETLEYDLRQQQASLQQQQAAASQQIESSERNLANAEQNLEDGVNQQMVSAEAQLRSARTSLSNAEESFYATGGELNDQVNSAARAVRSAKDLLEKYQADLQKAQAELDAAQPGEGGETDLPVDGSKTTPDEGGDEGTPGEGTGGDPDENTPSLDQLEAAVKQCQEAVEAQQIIVQQAENTYDSLLSSSDATYRQVRQALDSAATAYDNAQRAYEAAQNSANQELESLETAVESSRINANTEAQQIGIEQLENTIEDATITAPIDGTVTAVYAKEGVPGSGLLFVIENTDQLVVRTSIQEYDITTLEVGMPVIIQTDATGDAEYEGVISSISPTSQKGEDGATVASSTAAFDAEVTVTSADTPLRVGMNTQMTVVIDAVEDTFGVPYNAVLSDAAGDYILVARPDGANGYTAERVDVTTGLETDFFLEIRGEGLAEGDYVITEPEGITAGQPVWLGVGIIG